MVADQYRLAHRVILAQTSRRVGENDRPRAGSAGRAHRMHDMTQIMALIRMDSAQQDQHPLVAVADRHRQHRAAVSRRARWAECGQIRHGNRGCGGAQFAGRRCPAGSEDHRDTMSRDAGTGRDLRGRQGCGIVGS